MPANTLTAGKYTSQLVSIPPSWLVFPQLGGIDTSWGNTSQLGNFIEQIFAKTHHGVSLHSEELSTEDNTSDYHFLIY